MAAAAAMGAATGTTILHATSIDDFDVGQVIGRGGFGLVYRARHRASNTPVALKALDKRALHAEGMAARVANEVRLHARVRGHPNVVPLLGFFEDDRSVYLVLELCERGDLYRYLKRHGPLTPVAAAGVMRQVLAALVHLHGTHGVVHRDLKLSNLLLLDATDSNPTAEAQAFPYRVKLADFGLAARLEGPAGEDAERFTVCGTPDYIAPEVAGQRHGRPVDLWSAGCLLYSLLTGRAPFPRPSSTSGSGLLADQPSATTAAAEYEEPAGLSAAGQDFLRRLLEPDPAKRPTARAMLAHPFLTGEGIGGWVTGGEGEERVRDHSHSQSHLNDSSMLTVVPSAGGRGHHGSSTQHWASSNISVATVAPSLPPQQARRRQQQPTPEMKKQPSEQVPPPPLSLTLDIPPASSADATAAAEAATTPPPPHHLLHPRRSRRARAKVAAALEALRQQEQQQQAAAVAVTAAGPASLPFLLPLQALQLTTAAAAGTGTSSMPPLVPIDASRLAPARFLLPHPSGRHEGRLRLRKDGAVSLKMRSLHHIDKDGGGWQWALRVRPGGLRVRVAASTVAYRSEAEYTLGELPLAWHAAYRYCWRLVQGVRAMTPKMTLFLVRRQEEAQEQQQVLAKCMVMENDPLPDFKVRWADGAVLHYSLRTGQLTLALGEAPALPLVRSPSSPPPSRRRRHAWVIGDGNAGMAACFAGTGEAGVYLGQAQWAMRRCLEAAEAAAHGGGFPLVLYEELQGQGQDGAPAAAAAAAADKTDNDDYSQWPLVAALPGVGRARRSARGDLAVALEDGKEQPLVLVLDPDATQVLVLPQGGRYALPGLVDVAKGERMPKPLRARMRVLHRVLRAVGH